MLCIGAGIGGAKTYKRAKIRHRCRPDSRPESLTALLVVQRCNYSRIMIRGLADDSHPMPNIADLRKCRRSPFIMKSHKQTVTDSDHKESIGWKCSFVTDADPRFGDLKATLPLGENPVNCKVMIRSSDSGDLYRSRIRSPLTRKISTVQRY